VIYEGFGPNQSCEKPRINIRLIFFAFIASFAQNCFFQVKHIVHGTRPAPTNGGLDSKGGR